MASRLAGCFSPLVQTSTPATVPGEARLSGFCGFDSGRSAVPKRRPIRDKLLVVGLLVGFMVSLLSASSFLGVYSYRRLVRALSSRATELPRASHLAACVGQLRLAHARTLAAVDLGFWTERPAQAVPPPSVLESGEPDFQPASDGDDEVAERDWVESPPRPEPPATVVAGSFLDQVALTAEALDAYCRELAAGELDERPFGDRSHERDTARRIAADLKAIWRLAREASEAATHPAVPQEAAALVDERLLKLTAIGSYLDSLAKLSAALPTFLQARMHDLAYEVRGRYRTLIITTWAAALAAVMLLGALGGLTYRWVFKPLRQLGNGSRRIAAGDFAHRIELDTRDEMAELASALNEMTDRFQEIRDDLDRQVQLRTKEVIRSEQLASVGFLAAGVAHEINNPLASIAMCAESLEDRLGGEADPVTVRYLQLMQNEAFRCKGITERLLDFSRVGEVRRQATALGGLVTDVVDMLGHVGRFADKRVSIAEGPDVLVMANPQELKQVVLNLLVNAFDSIEADGEVHVSVARDGDEAVLILADDGCGMTAEVQQHLFEPFFTRRASGQGTGLGLSIVHRIVTDHGGRIEVASPGPGAGSTFRITFPVATIGITSVGEASGGAAGRTTDTLSQEQSHASRAA